MEPLVLLNPCTPRRKRKVAAKKKTARKTVRRYRRKNPVQKKRRASAGKSPSNKHVMYAVAGGAASGFLGHALRDQANKGTSKWLKANKDKVPYLTGGIGLVAAMVGGRTMRYVGTGAMAHSIGTIVDEWREKNVRTRTAYAAPAPGEPETMAAQAELFEEPAAGAFRQPQRLTAQEAARNLGLGSNRSSNPYYGQQVIHPATGELVEVAGVGALVETTGALEIDDDGDYFWEDQFSG